ncbi:MAG: AAA family ATPase, partial [Acidimicrobiia bacterium]
MLLERESELQLLADLLNGVESAGGKLVLLRGEAGIGKSSLVREFINTHADDAHIHFGSCDDLLTPQPLGPLRDIAHDEATLAEALANDDRSAVLATSLDLLSGSLRPNIVVFEDTHWADEATLDVIKYLGRRIARTNGLLLLTYRDGEVDYEHPLRQVIGELPPENLIRIHLDRLTTQGISELVGDADLDVDEILALTGGNPLFVTEVVASGVDKVPSSVQDSVLARAAKLSPGARQLLDLASVIPGVSERSLLDGILGPTEEHMTECARRDLLRVEADTVSFHHELTRRAVESALSASDRRRLNAEVLAELGGRGDLARLVHHAREAGNVDSIIELTPQAARAAMAIESHREAVAHFRVLEPYLDRIGEIERASIVNDWALSELYLGHPSSLDILARAIDLCRSTADDFMLARALTSAVRIYELQSKPEAAEACSQEAITILESYPPSADLASALSQRAWLSSMRGDGARALEIADRAIELAEATDNEPGLIDALNTKGFETYRLGDSDGLRILDEARRRAEQREHRFEESRALLKMAIATAERRELRQGADLAQRARDTGARYEIPLVEIAARAHYAEILDWMGEWAKAEDTAIEPREFVTFYSEVVAGRVLGSLQARQGRPLARATLDRTWARAQEADEMQTLLPSAAALAELAWLHGEADPDLAERSRELLNDTRRYGFPWPAGSLAFWLWKLGELSEVPERIAEPYRLVMDGKPTGAAAIWEAKGIPYERGLALMHSDQKDRLEALEIFETLGASAVAAKLRKALRDEGVTVPRGKGRDTRSHAAGLTAR